VELLVEQGPLFVGLVGRVFQRVGSFAFDLSSNQFFRVWSRVLYDGCISLWLGFISVGIAMTVGVLLGMVAGPYPGPVSPPACSGRRRCCWRFPASF